MDRKKDFWEKYAPYLCAFFIPVIVMIAVFIQRGIFPFGEMSFLRTDLYHQYAPFFQEMKKKLAEGGSLLYSWDIGMGTNFMSLFAYYLASPLNWLLYLCPRDYIIEFITYFIVIKIGLSSVSMTYYLIQHNGKHDFGAAFFGIFYGLSGYMAAYSWNIMWLDCILLFPLVVLGLERLVQKDKCFLYCISLGLCILSNYYIAIMICIFLVIYFLVQLLLSSCQGKEYLKKIAEFAVYSLLAGGLAAIVLLPEIYALKTTASSSISFPQTVTSYFSIFDMIARHLVDVEVHIGLDHWPNIYCGVAVLFLIPLYILNRRVNFYEKFLYCLLLLFFYLSFSNNVLNFIWHGLHFPNSLPARQSFIYIFLVLSMAWQGYDGIRSRSIKQIIGCMWLAIVFTILAEKIITEKFFSWHVYYVSILFLAFYGGTAYLYRKEQITKRLAAGFIIFLVTIEAFINTTTTSVTTTSRTSYIRDDQAIRTILASVKAEEPEFYRVEKSKIRTKNDGAWLDYPSISIFSSTANASLTSFFKVFGLESSTNAYGSVGSTFLSNMIFGVKYNISNEVLEETDVRELYMEQDGVYVYKNNYTLPLGFLVQKDFNQVWITNGATPFENLNSFAEVSSGISDLYTTINTDFVDASTYSVKINKDGFTYLYVNKFGPNKVDVTDAAGNTTSHDNLNRGYILDMGYRRSGDVLTIKNTDENGADKTLTVTAYQMNEYKLKRVYDTLSRTSMTVDEYNDTHINAHITSDHDGILLTTIPYDTGWTITVDGTVVSPEKFGDAFISLPLTAGFHTLTFSYVPGGVLEGAIITVSSLAVLIALYLITIFWKRKKKRYSPYTKSDFNYSNSEGLFLPDDAEEDAVDRNHVEEVLKEKRTGELPTGEELLAQGIPLETTVIPNSEVQQSNLEQTKVSIHSDQTADRSDLEQTKVSIHSNQTADQSDLEQTKLL
ncbi:MAG: YfhO family protein [Candidatus Fimimorpha sp.]